MDLPHVTVERTAVLVPVKSFSQAKLRLAPALDPAARQELARRMAAHVLAAAAPLPVAVVCEDEDVAAWARAAGADVAWEPGRGLDRAVEDGVAHLAASGATRVVVAHADLPLARTFTHLPRFAGVTIVPDRNEDGTNVICIPATSGFRFAYGPGSFGRHRAEARRLRLPLRILRDPTLQRDVDVPADLAGLPGFARAGPQRLNA